MLLCCHHLNTPVWQCKKIISLDSCSLIKLYNGRRCRKLRISQISHVPEKIQYRGKNTSWQWWLHQRVLSWITFLTELSSESLLTAPKSNMERPVFLTVWNKALHMSQTERKNSYKDKDCLIWSKLCLGANNCRLTFQKLMLVHLTLMKLTVLENAFNLSKSNIVFLL